MPSYPKFPRSNVPGQVPSSLDPGSFAINWADRKIFVGGPSGAPILAGFPLRDFRDSSAYRVGDVVVHDNAIWRCRVSFLPPSSFNEADWDDLTAGTINTAKELTSSVLVSGGLLSAPGGVVSVSAGTGIQMDVSNPADPMAINVSWGNLTIDGPYQSNQSLVVAITGGGLLTLTPQISYAGNNQRETIRIGTITTDDLGAVVTVSPAPRTAHQTADTLLDMLRAVGPFKVNGLLLSLLGPSALGIGPGSAFWFMENWENDPSAPNRILFAAPQALQVRMASRNGYDNTTPQASADVTRWDNGGALQAVPAGRYTNQFVVISPEGAAVVIFGQATHLTLTAATDAIASEWDGLSMPQVGRGLLLVGCLTSNSDGSDQVVTSSNRRLGLPFGGGAAGSGGDLSLYLLADGTRPMSGDLDLGGNGVANGTVDGSVVDIVPRELTPTGAVPGPGDADISVNVIDRKVYVGNDLVSQRIEEFDPLRQYVLGDLVIESTAIYRCTEALVAPGAFDPADWEAVGGGGGGSLDAALIKAPTTGARNEVDLTGVGGVAKAFSVVIDSGQGVDVADFGPRASINRFGVPEKSFGGAVFVVSQATHGFTRIGTPLFYNGLLWVLADTTDADRFPNVVISEIIDANNFTVQVAGRISNLNPAAFVGGVITPGTYYYASATPGLLTSAPGSTPVPVLYTISATAGLVKLTGTVIPDIPTVSDIVNTLYPVGCLYLTVDPTNPGTLFPGTTWAAHAAGRALVGVGTADGVAWTVGQIRGEADVALTTAQMPSHNHSGSVSVSGSASFASLAGSFDISTTNVSGSDFIRNAAGIVSEGSSGSTSRKLENNNPSDDMIRISINASHSHTVSASGSFTTGSAGSGQAHNNIQPSIGVFVWRRTA